MSKSEGEKRKEKEGKGEAEKSNRGGEKRKTLKIERWKPKLIREKWKREGGKEKESKGKR